MEYYIFRSITKTEIFAEILQNVYKTIRIETAKIRLTISNVSDIIIFV